jgi:ABC-type phosphate transport system substrate-binding protein
LPSEEQILTLLRYTLSLCLALVLALAPRAELAAAPAPASPPDRDAVVVIGHPALPRIDATTVQRLYTGRAVEVGGVPITVLNAPPGSLARERFMSSLMAMDDDKYIAYWTVRKHVGKGTPPREIPSSAALIEFVQANPGSVGYVLASELKPGLNVLLKR